MSDGKLPVQLVRFAFLAAVIAAVTGFWWLTRRSDNIPFLPRHAGAEWIVFATPPNTAIISALPTFARFRTEFVLPSIPPTSTVAVAVNRSAALFLNGQRVDGLRLEGHAWKQPQSAGVSGRLVPGTNRIELVVTNTFGRPAAWVRLRAGDAAIASDASWEVSLAGSAWRPAALARARPSILPGNLLYSPEPASRSGRFIPLALALGLAVALAVFWPGVSVPARRWLESPRWWLWPGVLVAVLWLALAFNNLPQLPRLYGFDAEGHEEYIRFIQQNHRLPLARDGWQMYQPPLYYSLAAAVLNLAGYSVDDGAAVSLLRWLSIGVGLAHCVVIFLCLRLLFPAERWKQIAGTMFAAFLPAHLIVSHYITNENLCAFWVTLTFYFFLRLAPANSLSPVRPQAMGRHGLWLWAACGASLGLALLTKFSAVLVLPPVFAAIAWMMIADRSRSWSDWLRPVGVLLLALVVACGWHYARVWRAFGTPLVGNWDAASGFAWWQFPGYRMANYYGGFGSAMREPLFSSFLSFGDGLFSTFWSDGLASGSATMEFKPPWNYDIMNAASLSGLAGTALLLTGLGFWLVRLWRQPRAELVLFASFVLLLGLGLTFMTLRVASYAQVKAFYGLSALLPLCLLLISGCDWLARRSHYVRGLVAGLLLAWSGLSFGSLWVRAGNPQTHVAQGIWFSDRGQFEPALRSFQRALELAPGHAPAAARGVETLLRLERGSAALALAEQVQPLSPADPALRLQLANALMASGDTNRAIIEFEAAARLGPQGIQPRQFLALRAWQTGEFGTAAAAVREALTISPYEPTLHALLGLNLAGLNDVTNALWHLDYACRAKPDLVIAQAQLGRLLLERGNAADAVAPLAVALSANPNDLDLRRQLALALQQSGQAAAAASAWRAALQLAPEQPDLLNNLAWLLATEPDAAVRNGAEAVQLAERACELTGRQQPALLGTLGVAYAAAGQFDRAISAGEEAIKRAREAGQPEIVQRNQELLTLYRSGRAYLAPVGSR